MLYVLAAIVAGLLLMLLAGLLIQPDDGKQPTGAPLPVEGSPLRV
jgi:hypothetical protein